MQQGRVLAERYVLGEVLGSGGSGQVYRATDIATQTPCAIKILSGVLSASSEFLRFKREFRAAARLEHPHCLRVLMQGEAEGVGYIAMELMSGGDLSAWPGAAPELLVGVMLQTLGALDHVHAKGMVHRDIKPQNILLGEPTAADHLPLIKLTDFGIAKVGDFDDQLSVGSVVGSLSYMPPEQLLDGVADVRSDLYALGAVLYEALTRTSPVATLQADTMPQWATLRKTFTVPDVRTYTSTVDDGLADLVMRLLAAEPAERPRTAADVYAQLFTWLRKRPIAWSLPTMPPLQNADYLASPRFVGRATEVERVERFCDGVISGSTEAPLVMCIAGKAGMGKSKLTNHLIRYAEAHHATVEVSTCRAELGAPFEPVAHLLGALSEMQENSRSVNATDADTLQGDSLTGAPKEALENLQSGALWEWCRQMSEALVNFAQDQPCLIILEDAQWADPHTLRLLSFFMRGAMTARRLAKPLHLGLLLTHRFSDEHQALEEFYEVGEGLHTLQRIRLEPLSDAAAVDLVASMLATPVSAQSETFTRRITATGENNPLFIAQILRALLAKGALRRVGMQWNLATLDASAATLPTSISAAVGERAARFSIHTKELLAAASVMGRRFDVATLTEITSRDESLLLDSLDEAIRAGFIAEDRDAHLGFIFEHDRFREAIYEGLTHPQRVHWHLKVGTSLAAHHGNDAERAADLAHHWRNCGQHEQAHAAAVQAARYAHSTFAYEQEATQYKRAIGDLQALQQRASPVLLEVCADACTRTGWYNDSADIYRELLALRQGKERIPMLRKLGDVEFRRAHPEAARKLQEEALTLLGVSFPRTNVGVLLGILSHAIRGFLRVGPSLFKKDALTGNEGERWEHIVECNHTMSRIHYISDMLRSMYFGLAAGTAALIRGPSVACVGALPTAGAYFLACGAVATTRRYTRLAHAWGSRLHAQAEMGWVAVIESMAHITAGNLDDAIATSREAEQIFNKARMPFLLRSALDFHGEALNARGDAGAAQRKADELWQLCDELDDVEGRGWARGIEGLAWLRRGQPEKGLRALREAADHCERSDSILYRTVANAHAYLEQSLRGMVNMAALLHDAHGASRRLLRAPLLQIDAAFLVGTAMRWRATGKLDPAVRAHVREQRFLRRFDLRINKGTEPMVRAGLAAWDTVDGKVRRGRNGFNKAMRQARERHMLGELQDVLRVACAVYPADTPEHTRWAEELRSLQQATS